MATVGLILVALFVSGCGALAPSPTATPTATATLAATATLTPTLPPTATPTATPSPTPSPTPTATPLPLVGKLGLSDAVVPQGRTILVRLHTNQPVSVLATLGDVSLEFVPLAGNDWGALAGISALAEVGVVPIRTELTSRDGRRLVLDAELRVVSGGYESETLYFTPEIGQLLQPEITQPEAERLRAVYGTFTPQAQWQGEFVWPLDGVFTSYFGTRRLYDGRLQSYHSGLDIDGETGDPVVAAADGTVVLAEPLQVRGGAVIIDHGLGVLTGYYHLDRVDVAVGQQVVAGEQVGLVGATGLVTGSHLHWELEVGGVPVDPAEWTERVFP